MGYEVILMQNKIMESIHKLINNLIKEDKLKFSFYNDKYRKLELIQLCYNKTDNTIDFKFRNVMNEYMKDLKEIIKEIREN